MTYLNPVVLEAARVVVRQAAETAAATLVSSSATPGPNTISLSATSSPSPTAVTLTSAGASPTDSSTLANGGANPGAGGNDNQDNDGGGGGGNSSSLLFFVALGFGVVFTNLWIIVGVKYCFRYNARNRAMRNEDGEPINMENMPRPHRRRREKKLMPMDEVNEKFPMLKYKTWVASRAQEGLPTRGGVSAPPSRPNSIRDADGTAPELPTKERVSTDRPTTSATATRTAAEPTSDDVPTTTEKPAVQSPQHAPKESTSSTVAALRRASTESNGEPETSVAHKHLSTISHDDDDDDDHIDAALPAECLGTSGDACAICIDALEDDDDVRGLTCGHAFHAACIDPWLTTRRACCPLCKADYYTPKPRAQAGEAGDGASGSAPNPLADLTARRHNQFINGRYPRPPFFGLGRTDRRRQQTRTRNNGASFVAGRQRLRTGPGPASPGSTAPAESGGMLSGLRNAYMGFRVGRGRNNQPPPEPVASGANPATTPSQLEAGIRNAQN